MFQRHVLDWLYLHPKSHLVAVDKTRIAWRSTQGDQGFNIYRGDFSGPFVDNNSDRIPDSGYGACANTLPNTSLSGTIYTDNNVPALGDGFFYLLSFFNEDDPGGESVLGANSDRVARIPSMGCP